MDPSDYVIVNDIEPGEILAVEEDGLLYFMEAGALSDGRWLAMSTGTDFLFADVSDIE